MSQYQPPSSSLPGQQTQWGQRPSQPLPQQRYPQQPTTLPKRHWYQRLWAWYRGRSRRKQLLIAIVLFVGFVLIGTISGFATQQSEQLAVTTSIEPTQTVQAELSALPTAKPHPKSLAQQLSDIVANASLLGTAKTTYQSDGSVIISDDLGDGNLTNGLTVHSIHMDCFRAEQAIWTSDLASKLSEVDVNVTMNVVDQYGNQSNSKVAWCTLSKGTAKLFNWSNLDSDSSWQDYDSTFVAPFLLK